MKTGLNIILSSFFLCVVATLFIAINFIYKDVFKVEYLKSPEVKNVETFKSEIDDKGIKETIEVAKYKSHLGFQMNYEVKKFDISLQSDSSVYFYLKDNKNVYLRIEKLNVSDYYESYNKNVFEETINGYNYKYQYLKNDKSYYKLTVKYLDDIEIDARFNYMIDNFYILD